MSSGGGQKCPSCFVGLCKRHPRQDHGVSRVTGPPSKGAVIKSLYQELVGKKLEKLKAEEKLSAYEEGDREGEALAMAASKAAGRGYVKDAEAAMGA